jgi:hypothetical protein
MANGDEHMMDGGVYSPGSTPDRTDVYVQENSGDGKDIPLSANLILVTGSATMEVLEILPKDLIRIGEFLQQVGKELLERSK